MKGYRRRDKHVEQLQEHYVIKAEWEDPDGWMDGFMARFFVIMDGGKYVVVKVNESGVFYHSRTLGWVKFRILKER